MSSRVLLNIALLVLVVSLGALVYFQPGTDKKETVAITMLKPEQVQRIEITLPGKEIIRLVKEQNIWRMTSPMQIAANDFRVASILELVNAPSHARYSKTEVDLTKFKLDKPAYQIRFNDLNVALGDTDPLEGRRYILIQDSVHLITDNYSPYLTEGWTSFVSLSLLPKNNRITSLALPTMSFSQADGKWIITPQQTISVDKINALIDTWRHANAMRIEPWQATDQHQGKIVINFKDQPGEVIFIIAATEPELVLARPDIGIAYYFDKEQAEKLLELKNPPDTSTTPATSAP